MTASDEFSAFG